MAVKSRDQLKIAFSAGMYPTGEDFADVMDSFVSVAEEGRWLYFEIPGWNISTTEMVEMLVPESVISDFSKVRAVHVGIKFNYMGTSSYQNGIITTSGTQPVVIEGLIQKVGDIIRLRAKRQGQYSMVSTPYTNCTAVFSVLVVG